MRFLAHVDTSKSQQGASAVHHRSWQHVKLLSTLINGGYCRWRKGVKWAAAAGAEIRRWLIPAAAAQQQRQAGVTRTWASSLPTLLPRLRSRPSARSINALGPIATVSRTCPAHHSNGAAGAQQRHYDNKLDPPCRQTASAQTRRPPAVCIRQH